MGLSFFGSIADGGIDPVTDVIASFFGNIKGIWLCTPFGLTVAGNNNLAAVQVVVRFRFRTG